MMKKLIVKPYSEEGQKSEDKFYRHHYKQDRKWVAYGVSVYISLPRLSSD